MRPIKLVLSAFGPYAGHTEIELDKLGKNGIYLITGDTGAGKTTIFDALCYALYGEASGVVREAAMFRSKYAKQDIPTFVELIFEHAEERYQIYRNPDYARPSKRGDKTTMQKASAELKLPDGRIITKNKEVNLKIREILGVDRNQFTQIAMIAQGEFLKLILASTEERQKIFRELFHTKRFQILQDRLKSQSAELSKHYDMLNNSVRQYMETIICADHSDLISEAEKARAGEMPIAEVEILLTKLIDVELEAKNLIIKEIEQLDIKIAELSKNLGKALELEKSKNALESVKLELANKSVLQAKINANWEAENAKEIYRQKVAEEIALQSNELPNYDRFEALQAKFNRSNKELEADLSKQKLLLAEMQSLNSKLATSKLELENLKDCELNHVRALQNHEKCRARVKTLEDIGYRLQDMEIISTELLKLQAQYQNAYANADALNEKYEQMHRSYLDEQAGILALELRTGEKCPVCGSTSHPEPASMAESAPSKQELESLKETVQKAQRLAIQKSEDAAGMRSALNSKREFVKNLIESAIGNIELETASTVLHAELDRLKLECKEVEQTLLKLGVEQKQHEQLKLQIPKFEAHLKGLESELSSNREAVARKRADLDAMHSNLKEIKSNLVFESRTELIAKISKLEQELQESKRALQAAFESKRFVDQIVNELDGKSKALTAQIELCEDVDIAKLNSELSAFQQIRITKNSELTGMELRLNQNQNILQGIRVKSQKISALETNLSWLKALLNTVNGNITGKEKIMLETYVQMNYFDRIIARANTRFMSMSNAQYELIRRQEAQNHRSQTGLELDVIDHYNGTIRSVKTLSGGELFKASLCLALGLCDEIQSNAGGIQLDSMFVDEGFGSLDEQSLKQAVDALASLSEGNRIIGIISHVSELKERIDKQIIVKKTRIGGSNVEIIN